MPPLEEQESRERPASPVDPGLPPPTPGTPDTQAHDDSSTLAGPHDNQLGLEDTVSKKGSRPENIKPSVLYTSFGNVEVESSIQDAAATKGNCEYDITASQYASLEPESQDHGDAMSFGALSPASERILQKADLAVSTLSPEMNSRFIQRYDSREDVMEEINSAFKFAKKENIQCTDKSSDTKSNRNSTNTSNHPPTLTPNYAFSRHRNTFSLPLRLTSDLTNEGSPDTPHLLKSSASLSARADTIPPANSINSIVHPPFTSDEQQCGISGASIPQDIGATAGTVNPEIYPSDLASEHQPTTSLNKGRLDSAQAILYEYPDQPVRSTDMTGSRSSQAITIPDTNQRKSQIFPKVPPNNRVRIKQPFPEVAQTPSSRNHQSSTEVPDQKQCEKYLGQPITTPKFSEIEDNCQSISAMSNDNNMNLLPKLSIGECLHLGVSRRQLSPQQSIPLLSNELHKSSSSTEEVQVVLNPGFPISSKREDISELLQESTPYNLASHNQQNRAEEFQKDAHTFKPQKRDSTDHIYSEVMATNDIVTQPDNLFSTSENQIQRKSANRPSSSQSQRQSHGNIPLTSSSNDVSDIFGQPQKTSEPGFYITNAKIKKSKLIHNYKREMYGYSSPPIQKSRFISKVAQAQQTLIKHSQEIEDILDDCQRQKEVIQSQQSELEIFKTSDVEKSEKIQALELEKKTQKVKIKKFEQLSTKYKDHMNEVVMSQKQLLKESQRIQKVESDLKNFQEAYGTREAHIKKLECLLDEVKELRGPAEKLLAAQQENGELIKLIHESSKTNELLQGDLNKNVIELGRERHAVSQLQKQLNAQIEAHKQLIEHLKNTRSGIIDDLTREGGILANILHSECSAQEKLEQLLSTVNEMKSHEQDSQPTLFKFIEDLSKRCGDMLQAAESNSEILRESLSKHFIDLKERVDQAHLDHKTEDQINNVIATLRETNAALSASLSAREAECKGMTTRIADLELDLTNIRGVLSTKCDELAVALALPKDDPQLKGRCHDLEQRNAILESQTNVTTRENISIKEELTTLRKDSLETEKHFHQLQDKYNEAQNALKRFSEEKKAYISTAKLDIEKARQDVAKSSAAAKNELVMRNDALVNNLEQRRSEAESQVISMKDELQQLQAERETYTNRNTQLQHEVSTFREKAIQQGKNIEGLEMQTISRGELEQQKTSLECARDEIAELKACLEDVRNNATQDINATLQITRETEHRLRQVNDLEREKESLKAQQLVLQEKYDALNKSITRFTQKAKGPDLLEECENAVQTSLEMGPLNYAERANEGPNSNHASESHRPRGSNEVRRGESGSRFFAPTTSRGHSWNAVVSEFGPDPHTIKSSQTGCNTFTTNHPREDSDASSLQLPYKPLKAADHKASHYSRMNSAPSDKGDTACNLQHSTVTHTSRTTHETIIRVQTPSEEIIPFSNFSPIQPPPSPLTDVSSIIDHLEVINNQQDLHNLYAVARDNKQYGPISENTDISSFTENPSPKTTGKYNSNNQLSSGTNEVGIMRKSVEQISCVEKPQIHKKPLSQNPSTKLKSALKKPTNAIKASDNFSATSKPTSVLNNTPSSRGSNNNQRRPTHELGYKRVVSGQVIKSKGDNAHFNNILHDGVHARHQTPQYQSSTRISEKSPLMPGPRRNERKRGASALGGEQVPRLSKAPRTSLHFKSATGVISDSQVTSNSLGDDIDSRRLR